MSNLEEFMDFVGRPESVPVFSGPESFKEWTIRSHKIINGLHQVLLGLQEWPNHSAGSLASDLQALKTALVFWVQENLARNED
jgi:hypothetical protein